MRDARDKLGLLLGKVRDRAVPALRAASRSRAWAEIRKRPRWVAAGGVATVLTFVAVGLSRFSSVPCADTSECVTIAELVDGASLPEAAHLYDREGGVIADVAGPFRRTLASEDIPDLIRDAFVAVEDRRYWDHGGIDLIGVARAAVRNASVGGVTEGASTIPMQLVRTLWSEPLSRVGPWRRKAIEARTALRLIDELGRDRVLDLYLNGIYLGNGIYGIGRAAEYYFGTGLDSLDVGQVAVLVGMTRAPELYDPHEHRERATNLRNAVLRVLEREGVVAADEAGSAAEQDLVLAPPDSTLLDRRQRTHLTAAVMRELRSIAPDLAGRAGLHIHTTIDPVVQREGEKALMAQLATIESGRFGPFEVVDSMDRLEGAGVALDPTDGAVLAWVGGRDFKISEFDRVEQANRQVGSLIKPFLVAAALEEGRGVTDMTSADTVPIQTPEGPWLPADHVSETRLPLREALIRSSNRAAAHLAAGLGLARASLVAERGGMGDDIPELPSASIGAFGASLLDVTAAYASFGNDGLRVDPYLIERVVTADGTLLWLRPQPDASPPRVMEAATAFVVLDAMRAVVDRGTAYSIRRGGYWGPAAGKTGTTNDGHDAWFVGLTPSLVAGVWFGFDRPREIVPGRGGGDLAAPAWGAWMQPLQRSPRAVAAVWEPPLGVERVRYDVATGEVIDLTCDTRRGSQSYEAWVHSGRYERHPCDGRRGGLRRLWDKIRSLDPQPLARRRGGRR